MSAAYSVVGGSEASMGVLLGYPENIDVSDTIIQRQSIPLGVSITRNTNSDAPTLALIGSGNYATSVLIPAFKKLKRTSPALHLRVA